MDAIKDAGPLFESRKPPNFQQCVQDNFLLQLCQVWHGANLSHVVSSQHRASQAQALMMAVLQPSRLHVMVPSACAAEVESFVARSQVQREDRIRRH